MDQLKWVNPLQRKQTLSIQIELLIQYSLALPVPLHLPSHPFPTLLPPMNKNNMNINKVMHLQSQEVLSMIA